jgi:hypothetical protein
MKKRHAMKVLKIPLLLIITISLQFCTSFNRKSDYQDSIRFLGQKKIDQALSAFPEKEGSSFITILERAYLNLLAGKPKIDELISLSQKTEKRLYFSVSRELKTFFYVETADGYYASEHEIIWMHFLLSWGNSMRGDYENAYVEAKKSSILLSNNWSKEGRFDDPLLRTILATLWAMCGHWDEARVDFRVAHQLKPTLKYAKTLADMDQAPDKLFLILGSIGPEPVWNPQIKINPFRGFRGISFHSRGNKSKLKYTLAGRAPAALERTTDSSQWYRRHFIRDNEIHDLVSDSRYGQRLVTALVQSAGISLIGVAAGVAVMAGGIALGGVVIYAGLKVSSSEIAGAGFVIIGAGLKLGYDIIKDAFNYSAQLTQKELDISEEYRFVRFLPEYAWVGWSEKKGSLPIAIYKGKTPVLSISEEKLTKENSKQVYLGFYPDAR